MSKERNHVAAALRELLRPKTLLVHDHSPLAKDRNEKRGRHGLGMQLTSYDSVQKKTVQVAKKTKIQ